MEDWERERILGEWGVRDGTVRSEAERRKLEQDIVDNPLRGRPLRQRLRNFSSDAESYVTSLGGPLPYMQRLRQIEEETRAHEGRLARAWLELADECGRDAEAFARRWERVAAAWSFFAVNALIERHNRNFPAESRLPMDPKTGDFALIAGKPYWREPLGPAWVLERFPPVLALAPTAA